MSTHSTLTETVSIRMMKVGRSRLMISLADGREVTFPLSSLPQIKRLSYTQRHRFAITGTGEALNLISFEDSDEIYRLTENLMLEVV